MCCVYNVHARARESHILHVPLFRFADRNVNLQPRAKSTKSEKVSYFHGSLIFALFIIAVATFAHPLIKSLFPSVTNIIITVIKSNVQAIFGQPHYYFHSIIISFILLKLDPRSTTTFLHINFLKCANAVVFDLTKKRDREREAGYRFVSFFHRRRKNLENDYF